MRHSFRLWFRAFAMAVLFLLAIPLAAQEATISAPEASAMVTEGKLTLIDLRTADEWRQTGVPAGARRIDLHNPEGPAAFLDQVSAAVEGDKAAPIGLICRTGNRSTQAQKFLLAKGFTNVTNVIEGMAGNDNGPGWLKRGLPLESCPGC